MFYSSIQYDFRPSNLIYNIKNSGYICVRKEIRIRKCLWLIKYITWTENVRLISFEYEIFITIPGIRERLFYWYKFDDICSFQLCLKMAREIFGTRSPRQCHRSILLTMTRAPSIEQFCIRLSSQICLTKDCY